MEFETISSLQKYTDENHLQNNPENKFKNYRVKEHNPIQYNWGQVCNNIQQNKGLNHCKSADYTSVNRADVNCTKNSPKKTSKYTVCVDWFETTILRKYDICKDSNEIQLTEDITLENLHQGTKNYERKYNVFYQGLKFGALQVYPRNPMINDLMMMFKVENDLLYTDSWLDMYKEMLDVTRWEHNTSTRIDIAIDNCQKAFELGVRWFNGVGRIGCAISRKGKANLSLCEINKSGKASKLEIGSVHSDKYAKVYNKTETLKHSNKRYISDFWKHNGLETNGDVYRYEITLRNKRTRGYDWQRFDDPRYLASVARTESKNYYEFEYVGTSKRKQNMQYIDWELINGDLLPKAKQLKTSDIYKAKQHIKNSYYYSYTGKGKMNKDLVNRLVLDNRLEDWLKSKIEFWYRDWDKEMKMEQRQNNYFGTDN